MKYRILGLLLFSMAYWCQSCDKNETKNQEPSGWISLLDTNLSQWEKFIGVPHYTVELEGYPKGDGMNGTPIGLNNDPLNVFSTKLENGQVVLAVSGQIYGGLTTRNEYENYHLRLEFRWGEKKYEPRLHAKRDNGILYHAYGIHGAIWNVWMKSQEFQVQEADMGDYYALGPGMDIKASHKFADGETDWIYDTLAAVRSFGEGGSGGRCRRGVNAENSHGSWNTLELICLGTTSVHVVNGVVVMVLQNSKAKLTDTSEITALSRGKIQLQSEGAEAYYRNIKIRKITEIPEEFKKQMEIEEG